MMPTAAPAVAMASLMARQDLSPAAKVALVAMAEAADGAGLCSLTLAGLTAATALPDRTLRRALHDLVEAGLLAPVRAAGRPAMFAVTGGPIERRPDRPAAKMTGGQAVENIVENQRSANLADGHVNDNLRQDQTHARETSQRFTSPPSPPPSLSPHTPLSLPPPRSPMTPADLFGAKAASAVPRRRAPHRLPGDWTPSPALLAYAQRQYPAFDLDRLLAEFVWFWTHERPEARANWDATFRKRLDAVAGRPGAAAAPGGARAASPPGRPGTPESDGMRRLRELAARMQEPPR